MLSEGRNCHLVPFVRFSIVPAVSLPLWRVWNSMISTFLITYYASIYTDSVAGFLSPNNIRGVQKGQHVVSPWVSPCRCHEPKLCPWPVESGQHNHWTVVWVTLKPASVQMLKMQTSASFELPESQPMGGPAAIWKETGALQAMCHVWWHHDATLYILLWLKRHQMLMHRELSFLVTSAWQTSIF